MSVAFIDDKSEGYIYNPVNSNTVKIPNLPATIQGIVWETFEPEKVNVLRIRFEIFYSLTKIISFFLNV